MSRRNLLILVVLAAAILIGAGFWVWTQGEGDYVEPVPFSRVGEVAYSADFSDVTPGQSLNDLAFARTGPGEVGTWNVRTDPSAPSPPNVLTQTSTDETRDRYPLAIAPDIQLRDVDVSARIKPITGRVDQAGGLSCRYRDENNYYVTRSNALEGNVRLYHVVDGQRTQFAGADLPVPNNTWHTLRLVCLHDHFEVYFDDRRIISARDATITSPGSIGLWTKADSVTAFDDLQVWRIQPAAGS